MPPAGPPVRPTASSYGRPSTGAACGAPRPRRDSPAPGWRRPAPAGVGPRMSRTTPRWGRGGGGGGGGGGGEAGGEAPGGGGRLGRAVVVIPDHTTNIKVTTADD